MNITRRDFAIRLAALTAAAAARPVLAQDEVESFRALSARLTGFAAAEIDPELAYDMIDGLRAAGQGDALDALLANVGAERAPPRGDAPAAAAELARRIAAAWYSGMHPDGGGGVSLRAYYDALVWRALEYTRPPGQCGAAPGDWSEAPAGVGQ